VKKWEKKSRRKRPFFCFLFSEKKRCFQILEENMLCGRVKRDRLPRFQ
jgi:hypothetical protein